MLEDVGRRRRYTAGDGDGGGGGGTGAGDTAGAGAAGREGGERKKQRRIETS